MRHEKPKSRVTSFATLTTDTVEGHVTLIGAVERKFSKMYG